MHAQVHHEVLEKPNASDRRRWRDLVVDHDLRLNKMGVHLLAVELVTREILTHLLKTHEDGAVILDQCRSNTLRLLARLEAGRPEQSGKDNVLEMHNAATEFLGIIAGDMRRE